MYMRLLFTISLKLFAFNLKCRGIRFQFFDNLTAKNHEYCGLICGLKTIKPTNDYILEYLSCLIFKGFNNQRSQSVQIASGGHRMVNHYAANTNYYGTDNNWRRGQQGGNTFNQVAPPNQGMTQPISIVYFSINAKTLILKPETVTRRTFFLGGQLMSN